MSLEDLIDFLEFNPDDYLTRVGRPSTSPRCAVMGCGARTVPKSPTPAGDRGVCGYCRARVKAQLAARSIKV